MIAVRRRLTSPADTGLVVGFALRDSVAAVVIDTGSVIYPVIVSVMGGEWVAPDLINGSRSDRKRRRSRQERTASPPRLMWHWTSSTAPLGPDGELPAVAWTVLIGRAALDGEQLTVESDLDVQSCLVGPDGFVMVFFRRSWKNRPRLTMRTTSGDVVALFTG